MADPDLDLDLSYDEGYFDKDAQGWCARNVQVKRVGETVTIRRWGDDNGTMAYDETETGTVAAVFRDRRLVLIANHERALAYVDLTTRRLRAPGEFSTAWFTPTFTDRDETTLARMASLAVPIARALGVELAPPAPPIVLSQPAPSATSQGSTEQSAELAVGDARWRFLIRDLWTGERMLTATVTVGSVHVGLHVEGTTRAGIVFTGPLERFEEAKAERARQIARWQ